MKREVLKVCLLFVMVLALWGCSSKEKELKQATKNFMSAAQKFDVDKMSDMGGGIESLEGEEDAISEEASLSPETEASMTPEEKESSVYEDVFTDYLKETNAKMSYKISEIDVESLTAKVDCKYIDSTEFVQEYFKQLLVSAFSGDFSDDEDMTEEDLIKIANMAKAAITEDTYIEQTITIEFEEVKGEYKVKTMSDELADVVTANCYSAIQNISDELNEEDVNEEDSEDTEEESGLTDQEATENITCTGTILGNGVLLEVSNNNEEIIADCSIDVDFLNDAGDIMDTGTEYMYAFEPGEQRTILVCYGGNKTISNYDARVSCTVESYEDRKNATKELTVKDNIGDDELMIKVTNNSSNVLEYACVTAVYYKDGQPLFASSDYAYDIGASQSETLPMTLPYNTKTYESVSFDEYKVFVTDAYSIEE